MENSSDLKEVKESLTALTRKVNSQGILIQVLTEAVALALNTEDPVRSLKYLRQAQRAAQSQAADKTLERKITKLIAQAMGKA